MSRDPSGEPNPAAVVGELARRVLAALGPSTLAGPLTIADDGAITTNGQTYRFDDDTICVVGLDDRGEERIGVLDETSHRINWRNREPVA